MTAAAPLPGSRASVLAEHATPGRVASFALHVVFVAAVLALPRPTAPPEPPVVRLDVIPPPAVEPPPPPPEPRARPRARPAQAPAQTRPQPPAPQPLPDDAEPLPRPTTAPRAEPLAAARTAVAPIADAAQDAPFLAAQAERAEALRAATTATAPGLAAVAADTPWIGGAADRTEQLTAATATTATRDLANAKAAPDQLQFAPEPTTTPAAAPGPVDDAKKRAEDEARKRAGLNEPKADRGDAPLATGGGQVAGGSAGAAPPAGGGAPASGGGARAAIRGIAIDGLNEKVGCDNPDDVRLSEDERAACNRRRWAGARGAAELGAVKARDQRVFDAAAARKTPPTGQKGTVACRAGGAAGATDCLPDAAPAQPPR